MLATLVALFLSSTVQHSHSAELILPPTENLYFQTNGALAENNNGDWWTQTTLGDTVQMFHIFVPESVSPAFLLTIDIFDPECFKIDELFTYTIKYVNLGPDTAKNVRLTDHLPPGVEYVSATIETEIEPSALVWHFAALAPEEGGTITLQVRAGDITGGADNTVFISSPAHDPNIDDNSAAAQVHILVSIELSSFTARILNGNVVLEWITRSESNNAGFRLYRAAARDGEHEVITPMLVRAACNSSETNVYKYIDRHYSGERLWYKLADVDYEGKTTFREPVKVEELVTPTTFEPIFPNPFNPQTTLRFSSQQQGHVQLEIYHTNGQLIKVLVNGQRTAGMHQLIWGGSNEQGDVVPSGTYISLFKVNGFERPQKMILPK
jgi:uncharacterized repeat protein (TIGR01451 family)